MSSSSSILSRILILPIVFTTGILLTGCDEDPPPIDQDPHEITLTLNHVWGASTLKLNDWYVTENEDSFQLTKLVYHFNNVEMIDADGKSYPADSKWFMVDSDVSLAPKFTIGDLDNREFTGMRFTIGVADSMVNATGSLNSIFTDPMYWGMANGYINFKLEGRSPQVSNEGVVLHTGGYLAPNAAYANVELSFPDGVIVSSVIDKNDLTLNVDLSEYFFNPNLIDLSTTNLVHAPGQTAVRISGNWASMCSYKERK